MDPFSGLSGGLGALLQEAINEKYSEKEMKQRSTEVYKPEEGSRATIPWLPILGLKRANCTVMGFLDQTTINKCAPQYNINMASMLADNFPYFLSKHYHVNKPEAYPREKMTGENHIMHATWFARYMECLGIRQMKGIIDNNEEANFIKENKADMFMVGKAFDVHQDVSITNLPTTRFFEHKNVVDIFAKTDVCTKAGDFLLEPCVLIQLPWQPTLLHQWIVAAITEVVIFEKDSAELRYWPVPQKYHEVTSQLLSLARDLKERIVLGFAILCRMTHEYPKINPALYQYLTDDVVAPSVPLLEFFISGKAKEINDNIKFISWTKQAKYNDDKSYTAVNPSCYLMEPALTDYYYKSFMYNIDTWLFVEKNINIFPNPDFEIQSILEHLKDRNTATPCQLEEINMLVHAKALNLVQQGILMANTVFEKFVSTPNSLPGVTMKMFKERPEPRVLQEYATEIEDLNKTTPLHKILRSAAVCYTATNSLSNGSKMNPSALFQIMYLQLARIEKEYAAIFINEVGSLFNCRPFLKNFKHNQTVNFEEISNLLQTTVKVSKRYTMDKIIGQLPSTWQTPITSTPCPQVNKRSDCELAVKELTLRTGRLIYNIANTCPEAVKKGGIPYPMWPTVQYVLPAMHSMILQHYDNICETKEEELSAEKLNAFLPPTEFLNFLKLLHMMLSYYENEVKLWMEKPQPKAPAVEYPTLNHQAHLLEYENLLIGMKDQNRFLIGACIYPSFSCDQNLTIFDSLFKIHTAWPLASILNKDSMLNDNYGLCYDACLHSSMWFFNWLLNLCRKTWDILQPGQPLPKCPPLGNLYTAIVVMHEVSLIKNYTLGVKQRIAATFPLGIFNLTVQVYRAVTRVNEEPPNYLHFLVAQNQMNVAVMYNNVKSVSMSQRELKEMTLLRHFPFYDSKDIKDALQLFIHKKIDRLDSLMNSWCGDVFDFTIPQMKDMEKEGRRRMRFKK